MFNIFMKFLYMNVCYVKQDFITLKTQQIAPCYNIIILEKML